MTDTGPLDLPQLLPGHVWLVGAGPGEPGLLTLIALEGLRQADVIVYDALVDERTLTLARPGATLEFAGKRGGRPSAAQRDISDRLVELAKQGLRVLRLKGGDPFVFGRGAEEALALVEAGIPFRIVPGITAGIGALTYAGIPATSRDTNSAVVFVTGHEAGGDMPDLDWEALAKGAPVLVVYMAMTHLQRLVDRLLAVCRDPDEPAAVISQASMPGQRVVVAALSAIAARATEEQLEPPALLVIGQVVNLRAKLDWLYHQA